MATSSANYLTKSRIAEYEQCEKRLWLSLHRSELAESGGPDVFVTGRRVGAIARGLVPDGVLISEIDSEAALARTAALVTEVIPRPLFEAAFRYQGVLVRIDVLSPSAGGWRLVEVKSSSSVKAYQISDLATQVWVAQGAGLKIAEARLRHIDNSFVYRGAGHYGGLLKDADVADKLVPLLNSRAELVRGAGAIAAGGEPDTAVGRHCSDPFDCPFMSYCHQGQPAGPVFPVSLLPYAAGKKTAAKLAAAGYLDLRDVPSGIIEAPNEIRVHEATRSGVAYHDQPAFAAAAADWVYPRYFLDFETIAEAIPRWIGSRPYQAVPFQFSCHVETLDGAVEHCGFLDISGADPSRACAEALLACIGEIGAIVTYNAPTERGCIKGLAAQFPDLSAALLQRAERIVDALPLVRETYYHPQMRGSFSIKKVLPAAVPALSYGELDEVQDGLAAQAAYLEAIDDETKPERRAVVLALLDAYCALDTLAMVELVRALSAQKP